MDEWWCPICELKLYRVGGPNGQYFLAHPVVVKCNFFLIMESL